MATIQNSIDQAGRISYCARSKTIIARHERFKSRVYHPTTKLFCSRVSGTCKGREAIIGLGKTREHFYFGGIKNE